MSSWGSPRSLLFHLFLALTLTSPRPSSSCCVYSFRVLDLEWNKVHIDKLPFFYMSVASGTSFTELWYHWSIWSMALILIWPFSSLFRNSHLRYCLQLLHNFYYPVGSQDMSSCPELRLRCLLEVQYIQLAVPVLFEWQSNYIAVELGDVDQWANVTYSLMPSI